MKTKTDDFKTKLKDWFVIQRIRITNFIKEHKFISLFIGIFIISCIVALVVFAEDDEPGVATLTSVAVKNAESTESVETVKSFSTIIYEVSYTAETPAVKITAEIGQDIDAYWETSDPTAFYDVSEDGRKIDVTIYDNDQNVTLTKQLYLSIRNVKNDTKIKPTIISGESNYNEVPEVKIESKEVTLTPKIVSGKAYKTDYYQEGRLAPFGIVLGFNKSELTNENSMEGLYFNPDISLTLEATQTVNSVESEIELATEKEYFGLYDKKTNLLEKMPHYKKDYEYNSGNYFQYNSINDFVYDSGMVESLTKNENQVSESALSTPKLKINTAQNINEKSSPELYLLGDKKITLENGEVYTEYGISTSLNAAPICTESSNECIRKITDAKGNIIQEKNITKENGKHTVIYEYSTSTGKVTLKREVEVVDRTTVSLNNDIYKLNGNKNIMLVKGTAYSEQGLLKNDRSYTDYKTTISKKDSDEKLEEIDVNSIGQYTVTYTILDSSNQDVTLTRTINVVEKTPYTKVQTLTADSVNVAINSKLNTPIIKIDGENKTCNDQNNCTVKYYNVSSNKETTINSSNIGTYNALYKINDENGFEVEVVNTVNVKTTYSLVIKGIKTDGTINLYGNDFVALGSYFVTAQSPRNDSKDDISVKLKIGDVTSDPVINPLFSTGTVTNELTINTEEDGTIRKLQDNSYLSFGEEAIVRSRISYSSEADADIKNLSVEVPISRGTFAFGNQTPVFTMVEYSGDVESPTPYYINEEYKDKIKVTYTVCQVEQNGSSCVNGTTATYDSFEKANEQLNGDKVIAHLTYTIDSVSPGSNIDFRVRVLTNVGNKGVQVSLDSKFSYVNGRLFAGNSSTSVKITPFKARTKVYVEGSEINAIIDGANTNTSQISIYPSVSMPAALINTSAVKIKDLKNVTITVTLPDGVNYIYNENYILPKVSGKTLTYTLTGKQINEWIDSIVFDISYDINIKSHTDLPIKVVIQATSSDGITDSSPEDLRTTTRNINYINSEAVSFSQYALKPTIPKNTAFETSIKLYNNDSSNVTHSNMEIITVLPYNDVENEEDNYTGTYTLSDLPSNAFCTTSPSAIVSDASKLANASEITWDDCSKYKNDNYLEVTAVKVSNINLEASKTYEQKIKINPKSNKSGDKYTINSYLILQEEEKIVKNIRPIDVEVISKRITGNVWEDFDANGMMDSSEKKVAGVTLGLYNADTQELIKTTVSDEKGNYVLADLNPGNYYVTAEYNTAKYGVSPYRVIPDKSFTSSFRVMYGKAIIDEVTKVSYSLGDVNLDNDISVTDFKLIMNYISEKVEFTELQKKLADVNQDGKINTVDATWIMQIVANTKEETIVTEELDDGIDKEIDVGEFNLKTDNIEITDDTRTVSNINLGLTLRKEYSVKLTKYITKAITTNQLGVSTIKDYGNSKLAKLDVKDINNLNIKVVYTIELENIGYYPGYIYTVKDYIPDGMTFNEEYEENKGWVLNEDGYVENSTLFDQLVKGGEKKYLTIAFDITRKEAGSFVNYAAVDDEDLQILVVAKNSSNTEEGDNNE